jgi:hypothetical protein
VSRKIKITTGRECIVCLYRNALKITNLEGVTPGTPGSVVSLRFA